MRVTKNIVKKRLVQGLFLSVLLAAGSLFWVEARKYDSRMKRKQGYAKTFPIMDLLLLNGKRYNTRQLSEASINKLIMVFDPDCDHCQYEIRELTNHADKFTGTTMLFISAEPAESLKKLENDLNRAVPSNVRLFSIDPAQLFKSLSIRSFPEIYLYGKDNQQISNHTGETPSTILLSEIK